MAKYDAESLLAQIDALLKANINTKLLAIGTEKADGIVCPPVVTGAYIVQSMDDKVLNYPSFIHYGIENIDTIAIGGNTAEKYTLEILAGLLDSGNDADILKKILRYQRALREIIEENYGAFPSGQMTVSSGTPEKFKYLNTANEFRVIGIFVELAIA